MTIENATFVTLKVATSLDGQIALRSGESKWISNDCSRKYSHYLRACHDAIVIGQRTVEIDQPQLNIRLNKYRNIKKKIIVICSTSRPFDPKLIDHLLKFHNIENLFFIMDQSIPSIPNKYQKIKIDRNKNGKIDLKKLLDHLYSRNIKSIFIEGGATLHSSFLRDNLVNRVYQFISPQIMGSQFGVSWTKDLNCTRMNETIKLTNSKIKILNGNLLLTGRIY